MLPFLYPYLIVIIDAVINPLRFPSEIIQIIVRIEAFIHDQVVNNS